MTSIPTMRSWGFSVVKLAGPVTQLTHSKEFTVNGKPSRPWAGRFQFNVKGWHSGKLNREIKFV
jgi:hypothetical protein